jgi:hypothetical protein
MQQSRNNRTVAIALAAGGIGAALFFYGLFTDWFGIYGAEKAPLTRVEEPAG